MTARNNNTRVGQCQRGSGGAWSVRKIRLPPTSLVINNKPDNSFMIISHILIPIMPLPGHGIQLLFSDYRIEIIRITIASWPSCSIPSTYPITRLANRSTFGNCSKSIAIGNSEKIIGSCGRNRCPHPTATASGIYNCPSIANSNTTAGCTTTSNRI